MATAQQVVKKARSYVGVSERPANSNKVLFNTWYYGRVVSGSAYPWCAAFTSYVFAHCGMTKEQYAHGVYTPTQANWYKQRGRWHTGKPKPGDVAFYDFGLGRISHTGIVVKGYGRKNHLACEGNTSGSNPRDGGMVALVRRSGGSIVGYGRPYYNGAAGASSDENQGGIDGMAYSSANLKGAMKFGSSWKNLRWNKKSRELALVVGPKPFAATTELEFAAVSKTTRGQVRLVEVRLTPGLKKTLRRGSTGADVRRLQKEIGTDVDGEFGPKTFAALKAYEKKNGMVVNGVVGKTQWAKMFPTKVVQSYAPFEFTCEPGTGKTFEIPTRIGFCDKDTVLRVQVRALNGSLTLNRASYRVLA